MRGLAPRRATIKSDLVAGVPVAISSVRTHGRKRVAGVKIQGLYASIFGPLAGHVEQQARPGGGLEHRYGPAVLIQAPA